MSEPKTDDDASEKLKQDLRQHRDLLVAANAEIEKLRERLGKCSTTILETVMLEQSQGEELAFLRARVTELEAITAKSKEQSAAAEKVYTAMRGAMDRMHDGIKKVANQAKDSAPPDLAKELEELEKAATAPMPDDLERLIGPDR